MKKTFIAISLALFSCLILAACTANATSTQEIPSNSGKNQPVSTNIGQDTSDAVADENCLPGGPSDTQLEYWEIDEFEDWMEQQRDQIQSWRIIRTNPSITKMTTAAMCVANGHRKM